MTRHKSPIRLLLLPVFLILMAAVSGCLDSKCSETCQNGGVCVSKACSCVTGYDGTGCATLSRSRLLKSDTGATTFATAQGGDYCHTQPYSMTIKPGSQLYLVSIVNFGGSGLTAQNVVVSGQSFYITDSLISSASIISGIQGTVTADGATITYSYSVYNTITAATTTCSGTATKQN